MRKVLTMIAILGLTVGAGLHAGTQFAHASGYSPARFSAFAGATGIAATSGKVFVTNDGCQGAVQIESLSNDGTATAFGPAVPNSASAGGCHEDYLAVSTGAAGFPVGDVYVTDGHTVYQYSADGSSVSTFASISAEPIQGITFDSVGTFGGDMVVTGVAGGIYTIDAAGTVHSLAQLGSAAEGPTVVPRTFGLRGGNIFVGLEYRGEVDAVAPDGSVWVVVQLSSPEGVLYVPQNPCPLSGTEASFFVSSHDTNAIMAFPVGQLVTAADQILVTNENTGEIDMVRPSSNISGYINQVPGGWGQVPASGTGSWIEGSTLVPCPEGPPADTSAPSTSISLSGTTGNAPWFTGPATVTLSATDRDGSGDVAHTYYSVDGGTRQTYSAPFTLLADGTHSLSYWSVDQAGNTETVNATTVDIDQAAPTLNCGSADSTWHVADISIACTAGDATSGLSNPSDGSFSLATGVPSGIETNNASTGSHQVCDVAGNCATAGPILGNMIDKKAPSVSITSPAGSAHLLLNQAVSPGYSCTDGGSGVASCVDSVGGTISSPHSLDTSSVGSKIFSVTATDLVGNQSRSSSGYLVSYAAGNGSPSACILYDPTRAKQSGSTIPIKLELCDANGLDVSSPSIGLTVTGLAPNAGNSNPTGEFRYDSTLGSGGGYIYNLKTTRFTTGTYSLEFTVQGDPIIHKTQFVIK